MKAYKGFNKDLTCRGFKFEPGKKYIEKEANCKQNGFHCAEDPLDCLTYYPCWDESKYYIVEASGDINEDDVDSKISCTEITLVKEMSLIEFIFESIVYISNHPHRAVNRYVKVNRGLAKAEKFVIVRGKNPMAAASRQGTILALIKEKDKSPLIDSVNIISVDGVKIKTNTWYTVEGETVGEVGEHE